MLPRRGLQTLRAADLIFTEEIAAAGLNKRLWQYFALLGALPGEDTRVIIALRAMQSSDPAQLAHAARLPFDLLERVTDRIRRERPRGGACALRPEPQQPQHGRGMVIPIQI